MLDSTRGRRREMEEGRLASGPSAAVLPRQLAHHLQQSLVLLFELLVLILDVIQVLQHTHTSVVIITLRTHFIT